jgi:hypothetical protein
MKHDVFISYSSHDKVIADAICSKLENNNIRCWIAPRDILPGVEFGEAIIDAIVDSRILLLVFSSKANESPQVRREVERAVSKGKIIIPFRVEDILPTKAMEFALSNTHWLDAMTPPLESHIAKLSEIIHRLLNIQSPIDNQNTENEKITKSSDGLTEKASYNEELKTLETKQPSSEEQKNSSKSIKETLKQFITKKDAEKTPSISDTIVSRMKVSTATDRVMLNTELVLFLDGDTIFTVGTKDSKLASFPYHRGTAVQYTKKGMDGSSPWYQLSGFGGKDLWLQRNSASRAETNDKRVFFEIAETGHVGYLSELSIPESIEQIRIIDDLLGATQIKLEQIISMNVKKGEMYVKTQDAGVFHGNMQDNSDYKGWLCLRGPCLITRDAVIALVCTNRVQTLTINQIAKRNRPSLIPELVYWDRSQLKFHLPTREAVGFFDDKIHDQYIQFIEQTLGWMNISIPQIKRLTVDMECKETPVVVETFAGNVYRGVCTEKFNISGTMISFDKVKNLVIEAFDRET